MTPARSRSAAPVPLQLHVAAGDPVDPSAPAEARTRGETAARCRHTCPQEYLGHSGDSAASPRSCGLRAIHDDDTRGPFSPALHHSGTAPGTAFLRLVCTAFYDRVRPHGLRSLQGQVWVPVPAGRSPQRHREPRCAASRVTIYIASAPAYGRAPRGATRQPRDGAWVRRRNAGRSPRRSRRPGAMRRGRSPGRSR
jgi:hypothetical protein